MSLPYALLMPMMPRCAHGAGAAILVSIPVMAPLRDDR